MKKSILTLRIATLFITATLLCSCMSSDQKKENARDRVENAQDNLQVAQSNENEVKQKAATADELKTFKLESELKIKTNEVSIAELKLKMNKPGTALNEVYARRIDSLEMKNQNLKTRIGNYEKTHTEWGKFKHDFNRDLEELGKSLKNMTIENKK